MGYKQTNNIIERATVGRARFLNRNCKNLFFGQNKVRSYFCFHRMFSRKDEDGNFLPPNLNSS